jgi:3-deoxy-D-manno-octulosonic-acid transferase
MGDNRRVSHRFYTFLFYCALPLIFLRLLWRARRAPAYRERWRERLAWCSTRYRLVKRMQRSR